MIYAETDAVGRPGVCGVTIEFSLSAGVADGVSFVLGTAISLGHPLLEAAYFRTFQR